MRNAAPSVVPASVSCSSGCADQIRMPPLGPGLGQRVDQALRCRPARADRARRSRRRRRRRTRRPSRGSGDVQVRVAQQHLRATSAASTVVPPARSPGPWPRAGSAHRTGSAAMTPSTCWPMSRSQRAASSSAVRGKSGVSTASCTQRPSRSVSTCSSSSVSGRIGSSIPGRSMRRALVDERHRAVLGVQHRERADDAARAAQLGGVQRDQQVGAGAVRRRASAAAAWPPARPRPGRPVTCVERRRSTLSTGPASCDDQRVGVDLRRPRPAPSCALVGRGDDLRAGVDERREVHATVRAARTLGVSSTALSSLTAGSASRVTSSSDAETMRTASRLGPRTGQVLRDPPHGVAACATARGREVLLHRRELLLDLVGAAARRGPSLHRDEHRPAPSSSACDAWRPGRPASTRATTSTTRTTRTTRRSTRPACGGGGRAGVPRLGSARRRERVEAVARLGGPVDGCTHRTIVTCRT